MYRGVVTNLAKPFLLGAAEVNPVLTRGQLRYWRYNRKKIPYQFVKPVVSVDKLKIEEPVSASLEFGDMGKARKFEWTAASMNARGFLRFQKEYVPPHDAKERVLAIAKEMIPNLAKLKESDVFYYKLDNTRIKFDLLSKTFSQFHHSVPNSMLYMMQNIGDVADFYTTEIKTVTPFDRLVRDQDQDDLPPNLHVQKKAIRFHSETDTMFGGLTAFPKSSTLVTGLRTKKKYRGYEAKKRWP